MYFLLNNAVLDIRETVGTLANHAAVEGRMTPSLYQSVQDGQRIFFRPARIDAKRAELLAAQIALSSEANAALFVSPAGARDFRDVGVRLASISLITVMDLFRLQERGQLTTGAINDAVWSQIDQPQAVPVQERTPGLSMTL